MAPHVRFNFNSLDEVRQKNLDLKLRLEFSNDLSPLAAAARIGRRIAPNRLAILPMEGCDSMPDGSPSELVERRYFRLARGGAGLIWWEACAVVPEGRANELQMMLTRENAGAFESLVKRTRTAAAEVNGRNFNPVYVLQLTHSGRYSRPKGHKMSPIIPQHDPILDLRCGVKPDAPVVTDRYLESLPQKYVASALLAKEAGFDGVDIKSCHRYLLSELLASHTRLGKYGGSYENRTRLLKTIITEVRKACGPDFIIACRFNVFDAHPYPYGFGEDRENFMKFSPSEPMRLTADLRDAGVDLLSNSAGNPYHIYPQVTRPFDTSSMGIPVPKEHQLESIQRLFDFTAMVQNIAGNIPVVGNGYTWLRQFMPYAGAANIAAGRCAFMGLGRAAFAYPGIPRDILINGQLKPEACCAACSKCTQIMRDHGCTGCVLRDSKIYAPIYRKARADAEIRDKATAEKTTASK
ncbi:MAG: NADH:flavin oxidoreductase [Treponema sp.]|nr:NADH:flavin oxidoreductase [Treponema sp.]